MNGGRGHNAADLVWEQIIVNDATMLNSIPVGGTRIAARNLNESERQILTADDIPVCFVL